MQRISANFIMLAAAKWDCHIMTKDIISRYIDSLYSTTMLSCDKGPSRRRELPRRVLHSQKYQGGGKIHVANSC